MAKLARLVLRFFRVLLFVGITVSAYSTVTPYIGSISPASGGVGTQITITGEALLWQGWERGALMINGVSSPTTSWTDTQIVGTVPANAVPANATSVTIQAVYSDQGGVHAQSNTLSLAITGPAITSISPTSGALGTVVTINGSNFGGTKGTSTVTFNGVLAVPATWSDTQITVPVPSGARTGNVQVTVGGVGAGGSPKFTVTPYIVSISPASGGVGTQITITGEALLWNGSARGALMINGVSSPVTSWTDTQVMGTVPANAIPANATSVAILLEYSDHGEVYARSNTLSLAVGTATESPTFTPAPAEYDGPQQSVTLSDVTPQAVVYYTLDGTEPSTSSTQYSGPIPLTAPSTTIKAIAVAPSYQPSTVVTGTYVVTTAPPAFSPAPGTYSGPQQLITLSDATPQAVIYYTTDGSMPTTASIVYAAPISLGEDTTIKATAVAPGYRASKVSTGSYSILKPSSVLQLRIEDAAPFVNLSDPNAHILDWVAWGMNGSASPVRKAGASLISDYTAINSAPNPAIFPIRYNWIDGTLSAYGVDVVGGLSVDSVGQGFQIIVPADTAPKTLELYVGISEATANLQASLSDGSAPIVSDSSVGSAGEVDKVYSIDFRAGSDGQTLTVTLTVAQQQGNWGYMGLQAAILQQHLPAVAIANPSNGNSVTISGDAYSEDVTVNATQLDRSLIDLQLFANATQLVNVVNPSNPFQFSWTGIVPGHYKLLAQVRDEAGLVTTSTPVEIDVIKPSANLSASLGQAGAEIDLTAEGTADWLLWGPISGDDANEIHRKAGVSPLISSYRPIGNQTVWGCQCSPYSFSFSDGIPNRLAAAVAPQLWVPGKGQGFELQVKADTVPRTLKLYVAAEYGQGRLQAFLSDGSAPVVTDTSIVESGSASQTVYAVNFSAASTNQTLTLRFTQNVDGYGDVNLQAATLSGPPVPQAEDSPHVNFVAPGAGAQGAQVAIYGMGFGTTQGSVTFNGTPATIANWTSTRIDAIVPSGFRTGPVQVVSQSRQSNTDVIFFSGPSIVGVSPNPAKYGSQVIVTGNGFGDIQGYSSLKINGWYLTPDSWSNSSIVATLPLYMPTTGVVNVTVNNVASAGTTFNINPVLALAISGVSVTGSKVTILGSGFGASQGTGYVILNNLYGLVEKWSNTEIVVTMQPGTISGNLYVHQYGADSNAVPFVSDWPDFTPAITSLSPNFGIVGDSITINGVTFGVVQNASSVSFSGVQANPSSWSNNAIVVPVPYGATTGNLVVSVNGVPSNAVPFTVVSPLITSVSPPSGAIGTPVTITGAGFGAGQGSGFVSFNGVAAAATTWSDNSVTVVVPDKATTGNIVLYRGGMNGTTSSNGMSFTVTPPAPVVSSLSPTSGLPGKLISIAGANLGSSSNGSITFNGVAAIATSWSETTITVPVPDGATSGSVIVTVDGVSSNASNFTVPNLISIAVTPQNRTVAIGTTQRFTAMGSYDDGATNKLQTATWSSSLPAVSSIDAGGNAAASSEGQTVIQAAVGSIVGSTTLTVGPMLGSSSSTGSLVTPRGGHTATLLTNGQVLLVGGEDSTSKNLNAAELYNPATGIFGATGNLNLARKGHTATLLANGKVLITGGQDSRDTPTMSAEVYDPSTGIFAYTGALNAARQYPTATLLNDGRVLVTGGANDTGVLSSAEIYDPETGRFTLTGNLSTARVYHTATLLNDGTVLMVGGETSKASVLLTAEVYDPSTGVFTGTAADPKDARHSHTATLLNNGKVLISQGFDGSSSILGTAELYDPSTGTFAYTGSPNTPRNGSSATLLNNGTVLMVGGFDGTLTELPSAETYDPGTGTFVTIGKVITPRNFHTATLLNNGGVLIAGGLDDSFSALQAAELYQPATTAPPSLVSISISPDSPSLGVGRTQRFTATGTFSDGSSESLASAAWSSSDSSILTVTNDSTDLGSAYAVADGTATVRACAAPVCGSVEITVAASALTGITIVPDNAVVSRGSSVGLSATGTYSNGATKDLTAIVVWNSNAPSIASVDAKGVVKGVAIGTASITAIYGTETANANISVLKPIASISVSPQYPSLAIGAIQQLTATAAYSDGTTGDVTNSVQWISEAPLVANLTPGGSLTAIGGGKTVVSANLAGVSGSTTVTVKPPVITIVGVSPSSGTAGTQVSLSGSGFGNAQGSGKVWLGTSPATVVSWSDTQVIAAVATGASSGVAQIQQNGASSNSVPFTVNTATINTLSTTSAAPGTQVSISGTGFGAIQGSGQVLLGTTPGVVISWADTEVVASVAEGSASGNVQILQNGVWSNAVPFNVTGAPHINSITPNSGAVGTTVTIRGSGFGSSELNGAVLIGGASASVLEWSEDKIVATVTSNAVSGVVKVQQNGVWSNAVSFTVTGLHFGSAGSMTLVPNVINMVVGDTRSLQAVDSNGSAATGLAWNSSDTSIISLSTDDPPLLTALAPGVATVTAGGASADITVYSGSSLPTGTVIWSNPGDGSGVTSILPAVPSATGVADVFAINKSGNVQAIRSDGTVAWTANVPVKNYPSFAPDFQGGMVVYDGYYNSIHRLDGMTGQHQPSYVSHNPGYPAVHTDGTIFIVDNSGTQTFITGIDPSTGRPKFKVPTSNSTSDNKVTGKLCQNIYRTPHSSSPSYPYDPIIAGDGYAYTAYSIDRGTSSIEDAAQPYPLAAYPVFDQLSDDVFKEEPAALADIQVMKQILKRPPVSIDYPGDEWDFLAKCVHDGNWKQASSNLASLAPAFQPLCNVTGSGTAELHLMKVGTDGSSVDTVVQQWQKSTSIKYGRDPDNRRSYTLTQSGSDALLPWRSLITDADKGALLSWAVKLESYCAFQTDDKGCTSNVDDSFEYHLTSSNGADVTWPAVVPGQDWNAVQPVLQLQDGSYVGTVYGTDGIAKFDRSGTDLAFVGGDHSPRMATKDGGLVTAAGTVFDSNLNVTGQLATVPTYSWKGAYLNGSVDLVAAPSPSLAQSYAAVPNGNISPNGAAKMHPSIGLAWCIAGECKGMPYGIALPDMTFSYVSSPSSSTIETAQDFSRIHPDWRAIIIANALRTLRQAFVKLPIRVESASAHTKNLFWSIPDQDHIVGVVGGWPIEGETGDLLNLTHSAVNYWPLLLNAQIAAGYPEGKGPDCGQNWCSLNPAWPPQTADLEMFKRIMAALGVGIGNAAAHELGHQFQAGTPAPTKMDCGHDDKRPDPIACENGDNYVFEFFSGSGFPQDPSNVDSTGAQFKYIAIPGVPRIHWGKTDECALKRQFLDDKKASCD